MARHILQALYDAEINVSISWMWDGGFEVKIGDTFSGFSHQANFKTWADAEDWLRRQGNFILAMHEKPELEP